MYQAQAPPTLEPEVCARADSPLLLAARVMPCAGTTTTLVMDEVVAPCLWDQPWDEGEAIAICRYPVGQIGDIRGDPPGMCDLCGETAWCR